MATRSDVQCQTCKHIWEITRGMIENIEIVCPSCASNHVLAYFGRMDPHDIRYTGAFNPDKYSDPVDRDIAHFRKLHL